MSYECSLAECAAQAGLPAAVPIRSYPVRVDGDRLQVSVA
jgi:hypothetical protein